MKKDGSLNTVCFIPSDKQGCGYYRAVLPSIGLCRQGYPAHVLNRDRLHLYSTATSLVLQGQGEPYTLDFIKEAKEGGVKVIFDLDDNPFHIPTYNLSYAYWTDARQDTVKRILEAADMVTTTTEYLAQYFKEYNDNVRVVPNTVLDDTSSDMSSMIEFDSDIIIGWIGASFHQKDLKIFSELIPTIMQKYKNVKFLTMGEPPPKEMNVFGDRIIKLPFVDPIIYHKILSSFSIQIGLAPLVLNPFNRSKSAVKVLEYLYMGAIPICSDIEPYHEFCKDNEFGLIVPSSEEDSGTLDDWMDRIDYCVNNMDKAEEMVDKGREYMMNKYNVESKYMLSLYKEIYDLDDEV